MALLPSKARPAAPWAARNAGDDYGAHAQPDWLENIPRFAQQRRVIVPDLPGFGGSEMPAEKISIPGYGRFIEALCDQLDLGEVVVIGNSMGGFVSAEVAIQFPERVERLVLVSAAGITVNSLRHGPVMAWGGAAGVGGAGAGAEKRMGDPRPPVKPPALWFVTRPPH